MALKIEASYETEIFPNNGGSITIKQVDHFGEEALIVLTASQLPAVIEELQALLDDRGSWDRMVTREGEEEHATG